MSDPKLHTCALRPHPTALGVPRTRFPERTIDIHCHLFAPEAAAVVAEHPIMRDSAEREAAALGPASVSYNASMFEALRPKLTDVGERLADMDHMGVDIQAISPSPTQYFYWADHELAEHLAALQNEAVARLCADHPDRFVGLGTVSLQHPELAAEQLERLMRTGGFKGVQISTYVEGRDVADLFFEPFWRKADALGAVVFIHPWGTMIGDRVADHYLMNTIGQPFETTVCLSKLIFSGALDRHRNVRIVAAHGGGYLPTYIGRSNHAFLVRPEACGCASLPSEQLKRIWYDSIVYDPSALATLVEQVGADRVLLGTDYPFDMGHYDPLAMVSALPEAAARRVLSLNAEELFGLDPSATQRN